MSSNFTFSLAAEVGVKIGESFWWRSSRHQFRKLVAISFRAG
jgi:hypothetical protein